MNLCFLLGKIISDIDFKFIVNDKSNMSISSFTIELKNRNEIKIEGYNNIADFCYKDLNKGDIIIIQGYLNSRMNIVINEIQKIFEE